MCGCDGAGLGLSTDTAIRLSDAVAKAQSIRILELQGVYMNENPYRSKSRVCILGFCSAVTFLACAGNAITDEGVAHLESVMAASMCLARISIAGMYLMWQCVSVDAMLCLDNPTTRKLSEITPVRQVCEQSHVVVIIDVLMSVCFCFLCSLPHADCSRS